MGKHAYCILAHNDKYCLESQLSLIDDERNDIYLLIDKKAENFYQEVFKSIQNHSNKSKIYLVDNKKRIKIRWGDQSQMKAEMTLFKEVVNSGRNYDYIHLLSGVDLPIKTQDEIIRFFDYAPKGSNFVGFADDELNREIAKYRTQRYHFFLKKQKCKSILVGKIRNKTNTLFNYAQKFLGIKRNWEKKEIKKGTNWVSITLDFVKYLVKNEKRILKQYRFIPCVDEIYKQTEIYNSPFRKTIYDINKNYACGTRLIDWDRGRPYIWTKNEFNEIMNSEALFARKFSTIKDKEIIDMIKNHILSA